MSRKESFQVCRGCGAPILWIKTVHGRPMICDLEPAYKAEVPSGVTAITLGGRVVKGPAKLDGTETAHSVHWWKCPEADRFRKGKPAREVQKHD